MTNLKPCAFCNSTEALRTETINSGTKWDPYSVGCMLHHGGCGACGPLMPTEDDAESAWNACISGHDAFMEVFVENADAGRKPESMAKTLNELYEKLGIQAKA